MYPNQPFIKAHPCPNGDAITDTPTPTEAPTTDAPLPPLPSFTYSYSSLYTHMDIHMVLLHMNRMKLLLHTVVLLYFILLQPRKCPQIAIMMSLRTNLFYLVVHNTYIKGTRQI